MRYWRNILYPGQASIKHKSSWVFFWFFRNPLTYLRLWNVNNCAYPVTSAIVLKRSEVSVLIWSNVILFHADRCSIFLRRYCFPMTSAIVRRQSERKRLDIWSNAILFHADRCSIFLRRYCSPMTSAIVGRQLECKRLDIWSNAFFFMRTDV